jgi:hypothetical protein
LVIADGEFGEHEMGWLTVGGLLLYGFDVDDIERQRKQLCDFTDFAVTFAISVAIAAVAIAWRAAASADCVWVFQV